MKKTYWWRIVVTFLAVFFVTIGYGVFYPSKFGLCVSINDCFLNSYKKIFAEPLFFYSFSLLIISLFLFFISDAVFLRWLKFALVWSLFTVIFVILAPVYTGGMDFGPTKELASLWMGVLFVFLSLGQIVWYSRKK